MREPVTRQQKIIYLSILVAVVSGFAIFGVPNWMVRLNEKNRAATEAYELRNP